ncbi:MAG: cation:proton antiporter, partial [Patescibacteria group bacterium]
MDQNIFLQISVLLGITVSIAFVMRLLRQPLIVAYIVAGLIAGPLFLDIVNSKHSFFNALAQFGIVLLLFLVGLSLNIEYVRRVGRMVFVGGVAQFFATSIIGFAVMRFFGFSFLPALFIGVAITFSSTIIVVKLLSDKKEMESVYGRYIIGVLLVQDIIAILILIFLNTFHGSDDWYYTLFITLSKGVVLAGLVYLLSKYFLPLIMKRVASSGEMLFIFTIAWCFGVSSLVFLAGFNIEIGAVIAGISLGSSIYHSEIISRIKPLRDFFIVLFFVVLGSELQIGNIAAVLTPGLALSAVVLIVDPLILYFVMRMLKYTRRSAFLAGVTAAQVSEFGFILVFKGQELGYLRDSELALLTIVALVTIVISSYLITYNAKIYQMIRPFLDLFGKDKYNENKENGVEYPIWIFGYHRIGWKVCEALGKMKVKYAVVDFDPEVVQKLKQMKIPCYFGDAADVEFLESLPLQKAKMVISTIPEYEDQLTLINHIRKFSRRIVIVAAMQQSHHVSGLYKAKANYVMLTHLLGGQWMSEVLADYPWTEKTFAKLRREQNKEMEARFAART